MGNPIPKKKDVLAVLQQAMFDALRKDAGAREFAVPDEIHAAGQAYGLIKETPDRWYEGSGYSDRFRGLLVISFGTVRRRKAEARRHAAAQAKWRADQAKAAPAA